MLNPHALSRALKYYFKHNFKPELKYTLSKQKEMSSIQYDLGALIRGEKPLGKQVMLKVPKLPMSFFRAVAFYYKSFKASA